MRTGKSCNFSQFIIIERIRLQVGHSSLPSHFDGLNGFMDNSNKKESRLYFLVSVVTIRNTVLTYSTTVKY